MNKKSFHRITNFKTCCIVWLRALLYPIPFYALIYLPRYFYGYFRYIALQRVEIVPNRLIDMHPCLSDRLFSTPFDPHYFFQGAWLARKISLNTPTDHVDVGSSVLAISVLSGFVNTTFIDFRPLQVTLPGLVCRPGDILDLPLESETIQSLSCLHVIEHIGLGRYGDPLDPLGSLKAAKELQRALKTGGSLYISTPVGKERVCFNAHRVFAPDTVCDWFPNLKLISFSCVDDQGNFHNNVCLEFAKNLHYGCGMFHFLKI